MHFNNKKFFSTILLYITSILVEGAMNPSSVLQRLLGSCSILKSKEFDSCIKDALNEMRIFYKSGIPEFNIRPFDPHRASYVEQRRGNINGLGGYTLILRNVSEYGWTQSEITRFKTDRKNNQIVYSQSFPEKSLDGYYEFNGKFMGTTIKRHGFWNLTLYQYSQTTTVKRTGGPGSPLSVSIVVDKIGNMDLHIQNFFGTERRALNTIADTVINSMWQLGLPVVKPLINDLVSTAFTEIFNNSFRNFPIQRFIR